MARKFSELRDKMSPESQQRSKAIYDQMVEEMPLHELRAARQLTQVQLASTMGINQAAVSKLERRADMYLSTLKNFVEAMGGQLEIRASFPDGSVKISGLADLEIDDRDSGNASDHTDRPAVNRGGSLSYGAPEQNFQRRLGETRA